MATEVPVDVVVAAFQDEKGATDALHELENAKKQGVINIKDAAVLRRDASNELHITETADKGFGKGAVMGGVTGAVVGVLAGPIGWAALGGAAIGGLAAKLSDGGFPDQRLKQIGEGLKPGSSAIVAVVEHEWVREVERRMEQRAADIITETIEQDIASQLEQEGEKMQQSGTMPAATGGTGASGQTGGTGSTGMSGQPGGTGGTGMPGQSGSMPGQSGGMPGQSGGMPGQTGGMPGQTGGMPGQPGGTDMPRQP
jgi:uncharacterized membrane protein